MQYLDPNVVIIYLINPFLMQDWYVDGGIKLHATYAVLAVPYSPIAVRGTVTTEINKNAFGSIPTAKL